jgi:hypothetical protein
MRKRRRSDASSSEDNFSWESDEKFDKFELNDVSLFGIILKLLIRKSNE